MSIWTFCIYPCQIHEKLHVVRIQAGYHTIQRTLLGLLLNERHAFPGFSPKENASLRLVPLTEILLCSGTAD
jgi:hypothetical protein